jgi:hypothetical protein
MGGARGASAAPGVCSCSSSSATAGAGADLEDVQKPEDANCCRFCYGPETAANPVAAPCKCAGAPLCRFGAPARPRPPTRRRGPARPAGALARRRAARSPRRDLLPPPAGADGDGTAPSLAAGSHPDIHLCSPSPHLPPQGRRSTSTSSASRSGSGRCARATRATVRQKFSSMHFFVAAVALLTRGHFVEPNLWARADPSLAAQSARTAAASAARPTRSRRRARRGRRARPRPRAAAAPPPRSASSPPPTPRRRGRCSSPSSRSRSSPRAGTPPPRCSS